MVKGFIIYKNGKIPFVIDKYRMELFTDDKILNDFMQEHNKKRNYILSGVYFSLGTEPRKITILVEHSLGSTCYLSCYIVENLHVKEGYDEIGIQSSYLDDVFRYKYKIGRNDKCVCGSGKKYKKCCISKYEKAARILQDIYNQKNVDYTIPGARVVEDSILEYEGPQEKLKNKHDKDIIEKIIELSEKEEIRKKP